MPANINTYIGREPAWHGLGTVTGKFNTWSEILEHGGLDYVVFKSQLHDGLGRLVDAWGTFRWNRDDFNANNREAAQFLGAVGKDYKVIQHNKGFEMIDDLLGQVNGAHYETAGVLGNGERVWGLADLNTHLSVGDDRSDCYLLFSTGHDGSMSHTYRLCTTRVVCQNTLTAALSENRSSFKVRHTANANVRIEQAHRLLAQTRKTITDMGEKLNMLARKRVTREVTESLFNRLFPKQKTDDGRERDTSRRDNIITNILTLYESNDNNAFPEQRGTAYNLLNAVTNFVDHERGNKEESRTESAIFGSGERIKWSTIQHLLAEAKAMQESYVAVRPIYALPAAI